MLLTQMGIESYFGAPITDKEGKPLGLIAALHSGPMADENAIRRLFATNLDRVSAEMQRAEAQEALHQSERFARAALDSLTARVAILDDQSYILATNQKWRDQEPHEPTHFTGPLISSGLNYLRDILDQQATSKTAASELAKGIRDVMAGARLDFAQEYQLAEGHNSHWFICRVSRFSGDGPLRVVVAHENITQVKQLEKQQHRAQRMESLGTLAGGVAHDLNNALAPILMSVKVLRMDYPTESELLDSVEASARRAAGMVRQLLTFAKGAEGDRVAVQPRHLIKELQGIIAGTFPKNILLDIRTGHDLPTVTGDVTQLHQVLLNLCVNARDAMPHGGTLTLAAEVQAVDQALADTIEDALPGNYVRIQVRDTGTGISPEVLDRIFEPFFSTKGPDKGTGLGLSTAIGIVKRHGGFLRVQSQLGKGSSFDVYLPAENTQETAHSLETKEEAFTGHGETILIVDDEPTVRETAKAVLKRLHFNPVIAIDGADGLVKATELRDSLRAVITDMHMPQMEGIEFVRALRRVLPDIPVAVASGRLEETVAAEFATLGVTETLNKPFLQEDLTGTLKRLLTARVSAR